MENNMNGTLTPPEVFPACNGNFVLAMARVPMQQWESVYEPNTALLRGTLFPALDLPYVATKEVM